MPTRDLDRKSVSLRRSAVGVVSLLFIVASAAGVGADSYRSVEVVETFNRDQGHLPEGVALDKAGDIYVSLGPPFFVGGGYGEIRQISRKGAETTLALYPDGPAPAGLAVMPSGTVYFALPDPLSADRGVYRVTDDPASPERLAGTENMLVPNGLAIDKKGNVYASDSVLGEIWIYPRGSNEAQSWASDGLLAGCEEGDIGANGIAFWKGDLYVANTFRGALIHLPISNDGIPGDPAIIAGDDDCDPTDQLFGMDGIALDVHGNVYALLVLQNKLVRIDPDDGTTALLLDQEDGLWNPASLAFGTGRGDRKSLFIANYAVLPPEPVGTKGPAVLKVDAGVPGLPLP